MSIFDGLPDIFTEALGESVVYTPTGGEPVTINAIEETSTVFGNFEHADTAEIKKVICVRTEDVPAIAEGDSLTMGGVDYRIVQPISPDGKGMTSIMLAR